MRPKTNYRKAMSDAQACFPEVLIGLVRSPTHRLGRPATTAFIVAAYDAPVPRYLANAFQSGDELELDGLRIYVVNGNTYVDLHAYCGSSCYTKKVRLDASNPWDNEPKVYLRQVLGGVETALVEIGMSPVEAFLMTHSEE